MKKPAKKRGKSKGDGIPTMEAANLVPLSGANGGVEVLSVDESYANTVHLRLLELKQQYESTYFEMARLLYEVGAKRLFRAKSCGGHESFEEYVGNELDFGLRKAQQLANIWWWYGIQQGAEPKLLEGAQEIGWTKASLLVKVIDKDNADKWFAIAKTCNTQSLTEQTKVALKKGGKKRDTRVADVRTNPPKTWPQNQDLPTDNPGESVPASDPDVLPPEPPPGVEPPTEEDVKTAKEEAEVWYQRKFLHLTQEQNEIVGQALVWAKKIASSDSEGHCLSLICQHFLTFVHDKETVMTGEWLAKFERETGLCVVAVDPRKDNEVVYGHKYLHDLDDHKEEPDGCQAGDGDPGA